PPLARAGDPLLARLRTFSAAAAPLMGQTGETLRQVNPVVRYLAPYRRELGTFLAVTGASSDARDHVGRLGRVFPILWQDSLAISPAQRRLLDRVLRVTGVKKLLDEQVNPYPRPGDLARPQPLARAPQPPAADPPLGGRAP
ncbi:MAG TPA: hypothetical protein VD931_07490, partial [Baekduia sp.]|nr:hypothetical protein [Baekduia sp.]